MKSGPFVTSLVLLVYYSTAVALSWQNIWQRPDQQGMQALNTNQALYAAQLFTDPAWRATAYYRAGEYQKAYDIFKTDPSAIGYYNSGNALAFLGRYSAAITAYEQALQLQPNFPDAKYNKDMLEKLLQTQSQQNQSNQSTKNPSQNNSNDQQEKNAENNVTQQQQHSKNQSSTKNSDNEPVSSQLGVDQDANKRNEKSSQTINSANNKQSAKSTDNTQKAIAKIEQQQAINQWLQSIPDEPGGLLQQKFLRDHVTYQQLEQEGKQPW